jgi:hypothetical protein
VVAITPSVSSALTKPKGKTGLRAIANNPKNSPKLAEVEKAHEFVESGTQNLSF